ncbi:MAG: hypothetical protein FVQ84_20750 [Planctomycetes bacterium]|nr:hypothetical protein [Planctomycetota bacterium]
MLNNIETIALVSIFIILLVVIFKPIKSAFNLDTFPSCVLSVCVSALCIIGMSRFLKGSIEVILLPYAVMAILILTILLLSFIGQHFKGTKDRLSDYTLRKDAAAKTDNKKLRR